MLKDSVRASSCRGKGRAGAVCFEEVRTCAFSTRRRLGVDVEAEAAGMEAAVGERLLHAPQLVIGVSVQEQSVLVGVIMIR